MRLNKLFIATLLAVSTLSLQSCLKDQEDFFDESSSERLQAVLDNAKTVLMSSENGWLFDYYPDRDLTYGGFVYTVKFDNTHATVGCELAIDPSTQIKSLYKLTDDNGPVLSFDSYNEFMHYFATPDGNNYEALDGDFEFMIMDVTDDCIRLRGKRTGNTMYLHRLNEDPVQALTKVMEIADNLFYPEFEGSIGGTPVTVAVANSDRTIAFAWEGGESEPVNFVPTPTGIRLLNPIEVNGASITELTYDVTAGTLTGTDSNGNSVTLTGKLPASYSTIDVFTGAFTFSFNGGKTNVNCTLVPDKDSGIVLIKGLNSLFDVTAKYDKSHGCIEINSQQLTLDTDGSPIMLFAGNTGGFYTSTAAGYYFIKSETDPNKFEITPNDGSKGANLNNDFCIINVYNGKYYLPSENFYIGGSYEFTDIIGFIKK